MKLELDRKELKEAIKLYLNDKGITTEGFDVDITVGRELTKVNIQPIEEELIEPNAKEVPLPEFFEEKGSNV